MLPHGLLLDPITKEVLSEPVLCSDGYTYSYQTIVHAMQEDGWHRSPITREVLRPFAVPNVDAEAKLYPDAKPLQFERQLLPLWNPLLTRVPGDCIELSVRLPTTWTYPQTTALLACGLDVLSMTPEARLCFRCIMEHGLRIMAPPPPEEAWDDCVHACTALFGKGTFANPWCLGGATVELDGSPMHKCAVEVFWAAKTFRCAPHPALLSFQSAPC